MAEPSPKPATPEIVLPGPATEPPGLTELVRFLYERRVRVVIRFFLFFVIGLIAFLYWFSFASKQVEGTVALAFQGMERHEYPNGKKFTVEDFRSPDVLTNAMADAGFPPNQVDVKDLAAHVLVKPVIPADIQSRWRKQDKDGLKKEDYFPSEFILSIDLKGLSDNERFRLFDAILRRYREKVKYDQRTAQDFSAESMSIDYDALARDYDLWDIPSLFETTYRILDRQLTRIIEEATEYQEPKYQFRFRDIARNLNNWYVTRLQSLEALTYIGRMVRDPELTRQRLQYRLNELEIRAAQKRKEAGEAMKLLDVIDRPKTVLAGQVAQRESVPLLDLAAVERLVKTDYVAPVVERISQLQLEAEEIEAERSRQQKHLEYLRDGKTPPIQEVGGSHRKLVETVTAELQKIIRDYNQVTDEYISATVTNLIYLRYSPVITRGGYSPALIFLGMVGLSLFLALFVMIIEHLLQSAKTAA